MNEKKRRSLNMMWKYYGGGADEQIVTGSASGSIATFETNLRRNLKSLVVNIQPVQAGSGTPSPTNVRPISGWNNVNIYRSGADTSDPDVYPVDLPCTVYGGVLDVVKGTLTVDKEYIDFATTSYNLRMAATNGSLQRVQLTSKKFKAAINNNTPPEGLISNRYQTIGAGTSGGTYGQNMGVSIDNAGYMYLFDADIQTVDAWKTSGTTVVALLAKSQSYTLTPTEIRTLIGTNNIWADAGPVNVEYYKEV